MEMTPNAKKAFKELKKLGAPVHSSEGYPERGFFWISAEDENAGEWLDYFTNYWGTDKLQEVLGKYGLFFEWSNPGFANVWEI